MNACAIYHCYSYGFDKRSFGVNLGRLAKPAGTIGMALGNGQLMQECLPKQQRMGTAKMKQDKDTEGHGQEKKNPRRLYIYIYIYIRL